MEGRDAWLSIWKVNRGYVAKRGCQYLVFKCDEEQQMIEAFSDLLEDEGKARAKWCDDWEIPQPPVPMPAEPR